MCSIATMLQPQESVKASLTATPPLFAWFLWDEPDTASIHRDPLCFTFS